MVISGSASLVPVMKAAESWDDKHGSEFERARGPKIGYLVAGMLGGLSGALGVFLPCFLFVIIPASYFQRIAKNPWIAAFVEGVTVAATGAIAGAAIVLGRRAITDAPAALIGRAAFLVLWRVRRA
ncbi:MAG: chromate transporter [Acidobacteria bacterium]|nr:chromate transporter [Acidobacteriota bacterium]